MSGYQASNRAIAHHEAAHVVVAYRLIGAAGSVSIVPQPEDSTLGRAEDCFSNAFCSPKEIEARILTAYAGGHAERTLMGDTSNDVEEWIVISRKIDDAIADLALRNCGWEEREQELRACSADLVRQFWPEIGAVADELLCHGTLSAREVEFIVEGKQTELAEHRQLINQLQGRAG